MEDVRTEPASSSADDEEPEVPTNDVITRNCSTADYLEFKSEVLSHYRKQFRNPADEVNPSLPPSEWQIKMISMMSGQTIGKINSTGKQWSALFCQSDFPHISY